MSQITTDVLDVATIFGALDGLQVELKKPGMRWSPAPDNPMQETLLDWHEELRHLVPMLTGMKYKGSRFYEELNQFLVAERFDPMFRPFDPVKGMGVASILDKLVMWPEEGERTWMQDPDDYRNSYPAFILAPEHTNVYNVPGHDGHLAQFATTSADTGFWVWLPDGDASYGGLDMVEMIMTLSAARRELTYDLRGVVSPMVQIDAKPDLNWMVGASLGSFIVKQAFQQFKFKMNHKGARGRVVTGMSGLESIRRKLVLLRPFYAWFAQAQLPLMMMRVGKDSWSDPGDLNDM